MRNKNLHRFAVEDFDDLAGGIISVGERLRRLLQDGELETSDVEKTEADLRDLIADLPAYLARYRDTKPLAKDDPPSPAKKDDPPSPAKKDDPPSPAKMAFYEMIDRIGG